MDSVLFMMFSCCGGNRGAGMQSRNCSLAVPLRMSVTSGQGRCLKPKELGSHTLVFRLHESPSESVLALPQSALLRAQSAAQLVFRSTVPDLLRCSPSLFSGFPEAQPRTLKSPLFPPRPSPTSLQHTFTSANPASTNLHRVLGQQRRPLGQVEGEKKPRWGVCLPGSGCPGHLPLPKAMVRPNLLAAVCGSQISLLSRLDL